MEVVFEAEYNILLVIVWSTTLYVMDCVISSVATAIAGVFANFANKIGKITEKLKDVDKAKAEGSPTNIS